MILSRSGKAWNSALLAELPEVLVRKYVYETVGGSLISTVPLARASGHQQKQRSRDELHESGEELARVDPVDQAMVDDE